LKKITFPLLKGLPEIPPAPLFKGGLGGILVMGNEISMALNDFQRAKLIRNSKFQIISKGTISNDPNKD